MRRPPTNERRLRLLRVFLAWAAVAWGISIVAVVVGWPTAVRRLRELGAGPLPDDPLLDYWLRMTAGMFTLVGLWFMVLAIWPRRFAAAIPWWGTFLIVVGLVLAVHARRLGLPFQPAWVDAANCLLAGGLIVAFSGAARGVPKNRHLPSQNPSSSVEKPEMASTGR